MCLPLKGTIIFLSPIIVYIIITLAACNKDNSPPDDMYTWTITTESSNGSGGTSVNRCYIDLYDGKSYTSNDTSGISREKVDLFYLYVVSSGNFYRTLNSFFYSSSTGDTVTVIVNAESQFLVSNNDFEALKSSSDIENLMNSKVRFNGVNIIAHLSYMTDNSIGNIFAFATKKGKLGFLKVGPYTSQVPPTDKATLTLTMKIQK